MKHNLLLLISFLGGILSAQNDTSIYLVQRRIETSDYVLSVPEKWRNVNGVADWLHLCKLDFSEVGLPQVVKNIPLVATFELRKYECANIKAAEDYVVNEFNSYPDRTTPPGYNYGKDSIQIKSGETAVLYSIHFYRRSKVSNFTRYDMIVYSKKRKAAYMLNITYQYKDSTYAIEDDFKFRQYATRIFQTLVLR